eukprot:scaffold7463_cov76-Skeletonema_dohrnii-CCMP3373.AAC.1
MRSSLQSTTCSSGDVDGVARSWWVVVVNSFWGLFKNAPRHVWWRHLCVTQKNFSSFSFKNPERTLETGLEVSYGEWASYYYNVRMNISSSSAAAAAAAAAANSVKLREDEFARLTHDDFVALHASRHNERQLLVPSLRIKRSIYSALVLCLCAFILKTLVSASNAIMRGEYAKDRHVATDQLLNLTVVNESNLSRVQQRWNSISSSSSSQNEVSMSIDSKASRHIWIDVISYAEGIAGWKTSLLELLHLAQALNATLVEPCMTSGRLGSCGDEFNIPVSDLFDLADYMVPSIGKRHPELVSYDKYQAALDNSYLDIGMVKLCLLNDMRLNIDNNRCSAETPHIGDMGRNDLMHILDIANEDNFILHTSQKPLLRSEI